MIPSTQRLMTKMYYDLFPDGRCWLSLTRRGPRYETVPGRWWEFWREQRRIYVGEEEREVVPRQEVAMRLDGNRITFGYPPTTYDDLDPGRYYMGLCPGPDAKPLDEMHLYDMIIGGALVVNSVTFELK